MSSKVFGFGRCGVFLPPYFSEKDTESATRDGTGQAAARHSSRLLDWVLHLHALEALRHREFRLLWFGHVFTSMAFWMDQVTRGWLIYELTNSTVQLGLVRGVQAIPILLLSPLAGSAADRYSRKMQILITQTCDGVMYGVLALLIISDGIEVWHVYMSAAMMAIDQTFLQPARAAIIADVVPRNRLANAIGLNSMIFNLARSTGPALAGVLIASVGTGGAYASQATFCVLATFWTFRLRTGASFSAGAHNRLGRETSLRRSIIEGWKFSWQNQTVRAALLITMLASLFVVPFVTLLPVFARDILGVGATGQGLLLTGMGIGALGSAVVIATFGDRMPRGVFMLGGVAVYGVSLVAFAASPWFGLSMALMVIIGFTNVCSHALVQTVIQTYSPSELRGRTMAIFQLGQVVMTVGSIIIGSLAAFCGARWAVALMGAAGALAILAIHMMMPRAWTIR
jgi:MFS family permease